MSKVYLKLYLAFLFILVSFCGFSQVSVTATGGTTGPTSYTTLKAAFDAVNAGTHTGTITISITGNTTEGAEARLKKSGTGSASYTSVVIKPATGVTATIAGSVATSVVSILGNNVTIDGSNNGSTSRNLTISNLDTSKFATLAIYSSSGTAISGVTVKNTILKNAFVDLFVSDTSNTVPGGNFSNITLQNNALQTAHYGIAAVGNGSGSGSGLAITGNDLSASGANALFSEGIFVAGVDGATISGNTIANFNAVEDNYDVGIDISTLTKNTTVQNNKINNLSYGGSNGLGAEGIYIATSTINAGVVVANNMISNIYGDAWGAGIEFGGNAQSGITIAYNSISLAGSTISKANAYSVGILLGSGSYATIVNNIISNNLGLSGVTGYGAVGISATNANQFTELDYNDYYINPASGAKTFGIMGSLAYNSLSSWQNGTGKDLHSKNIMPVFVSSTDLHLVPASNAGLDNAGKPVTGITLDIDGDTRNATTPDIGADEFISSGTDAAAPTIAFIALTSTCSTSDRTLSNVYITDATGVATTGSLMPRIYYKKSSGSTWYSKPGTLTAGTGTNGTWSFTITASDMGGLSQNDVVQYYIIAQDAATTPNIGSTPTGVTATNVNTVTTPPTSLYSFTVGGNLSGSINVGAGQTYTTLTAASAAYNTGCLTGPVTFNLTSTTYVGETLPIVFNTNPTASATNTLTIKPATGVTASLVDSNGTAMIWLRGADYVTIDGSNNGTTSRNLTISNTKTTTLPAIIWITAASATDGATNNTIKNLNLVGNATKTTLGGIIAGGYSSFGGASEKANSNNTITNNVITRAYYGISITGPAAPEVQDQNWTISNNTIGSSTVADKLSLMGIDFGNAQNFTISGNTISGAISTLSLTASGIYLSGDVSNGTVSGNKISDVKNTNSVGWGSNGIALESNSSTSNISVYNNFISDVASVGYQSRTIEDNGYGMIVSYGGGYNIYYNTVVMNTNQSNASGYPAAFNVDAATGLINLRNNIFVNNQTSGTERYAIMSSMPSTTFSAIDYNDYYTTGPNLGYIGSNRTNLAAVQTGFGGNTNSKNVLPVFISATDFHLAGTAANTTLKTGTPISGITTDYDGETRSTTATTMGADEIGTTTAIPFIVDADIQENALWPNVVRSSANLRVKANRSNVIEWQVTDISGRLVMKFSQSIQAGVNDYSLQLQQLAAGSYQITGQTTKGAVPTLRFEKL